eukprot:220646-Prorocentrum_minimum.AAC.1
MGGRRPPGGGYGDRLRQQVGPGVVPRPLRVHLDVEVGVARVGALQLAVAAVVDAVPLQRELGRRRGVRVGELHQHLERR